MCIKDYETEIGGQGPVRAVELLEKKKNVKHLSALHSVQSSVGTRTVLHFITQTMASWVLIVMMILNF
jgi:hypothetical protein